MTNAMFNRLNLPASREIEAADRGQRELCWQTGLI